MRHASPMDTPALHALVPLAATLALRVAAAAPDGVTVELDHRPELCTAGGVLHGGAIMALADTAGALCAYLNLPEGATGTTTVESKTNLLAAVRGAPLPAPATPLHLGSRLVVVETKLRRDDGRLAAKTTQTQAVPTAGARRGADSPHPAGRIAAPRGERLRHARPAPVAGGPQHAPPGRPLPAAPRPPARGARLRPRPRPSRRAQRQGRRDRVGRGPREALRPYRALGAAHRHRRARRRRGRPRRAPPRPGLRHPLRRADPRRL